jgi:hypothetical protein
MPKMRTVSGTEVMAILGGSVSILFHNEVAT